MHRNIAAALVALILSGPLSIPNQARAHSGEFMLGYDGGPGVRFSLVASDFLNSRPLEARFGFGYADVSAGESDGARRIFINDATNGVPEKDGRSWSYFFDLAYPIGGQIGGQSMSGLLLFGGPRYSRYTANFKFVGGNEDFDVTSHQWGFGGGLESPHEINYRTEWIIRAGVDYYLDSTLYGHDTSYSPDGEHVNPRDDYDWDDADAVIEQPGLVTSFMTGLRYRF
jgi:hypothetical protein